jgi:LCP family protein required for cell wall assembly
MRKSLLLIFGLIACATLVAFGVKSGFTIHQVFQETNVLEAELPERTFKPFHDPNRLNVLLLGMRGVDDPNGGLLTDSILLISVQKETGATAFTSIPRDVYLKLPDGEETRINAAYAKGELWRWGGGGLVWARQAAEHVSGVAIDYVVNVDFKAFEEVIKTLGGVTITLDKAFEEGSQWAGYAGFASSSGAFILPVGTHVLDSATALFYVRSRFSTSDFDRARRLQQLLLAMRRKAFSLGLLANPLKLSRLLEALGSHVRTNASPEDLQVVTFLVSKIKSAEPKHVTLDASQAGLLYAETIKGSYVLLPRDGTFEAIRNSVKNVFD